MRNIKLAGLQMHTTAIHLKDRRAMLRYNSRYRGAIEAMLHTFQTTVQNECENQACTWGRQLLITNIYCVQHDAEGKNRNSPAKE